MKKKKKKSKLKSKQKSKSKIKYLFIGLLLVLILFFGYLLRKPDGLTENSEWGLAYSKIFSTQLGLDWKETYLAVLDDLRPKSLRLPIYWQDVEQQPGKYTFSDYDWMVQQAQKRKIKLILVLGYKVPRWPECNMPDWAKNIDDNQRQENVLKLISEGVNRYKKYDNIEYWQVENEPFLAFGDCPKLDPKFLEKEISLVHSLDPKRQVLTTDSGELSYWVSAAKRGDIFGTTMYRVIWSKKFGYFHYPLPPRFFWLKANIVHLFYPGKPIIVSELQAEPWGPQQIYQIPVSEQEKSMNIEQFYANINYAKEVGFPVNYLWGAEWWYWMKVHENRPEFWDYAKQIIHEQ